ncbi:hypothetical protein KDA_19640 [Dictyobacter alpinus]|uniref:Pyrrolo-quinoline quinone repeat domain-containing protein n=1 Tax=Dictyobacter alpinus TaxID=2014873 RepID=A0A402B558_9CHLR|nr:PQQ-binding-like beta-propeller repeat protein [Dictyobacter alpinus]GCE26480.1 hypothetical protein KDA_19640 [Dictyobacter alpinus]
MKTPFANNNTSTDRGMYIAQGSHIYKASIDEQAIIWRRDIAGLGSSLIVANGMVYVYASQNESMVYALHVSTGREIWSTSVSPYLVEAGIQVSELMAMALIDTILYVLSFQGTITALNATTGILIATYEIPPLQQDIHLGAIELIIANSILYYSSQNNLYALELQNFRQRWRSTLQAPQNFLAHSLDHTSIYAIADLDPEGSYVYAFSAESGRQNWCSNLLPDPIFDAPVCTDDTLYCMGATTIYALNARSGEIQWEHFVGKTAGLKPCIENDMLYLCLAGTYQQESFAQENPLTEQSALLALDRHTGSLHWYRNLNLHATMFHVKQGIFYLYCSTTNKIYAFNGKDGSAQGWLNSPVNQSATNSEAFGFGSSLIVVP